MDGVIFRSRNFWLDLHKRLGTYEEGIRLTEKYLKTDYPRLVEEVIGRLWKGRDATPYFDLVKNFEYVKGAPEALKKLRRLGHKTAIISSSVRHQALRVKEECGIDYFHTHDLRIKNNRFTGEFEWDSAHEDKRKFLKEFAKLAGCKMEETVFVGHDYNDVGALRLAGLGIAFCPDEKEAEEAADVVVDKKDLRNILPLVLKG